MDFSCLAQSSFYRMTFETAREVYLNFTRNFPNFTRDPHCRFNTQHPALVVRRRAICYRPGSNHAESVHLLACAIEEPNDSRRHSLMVRITHWSTLLPSLGCWSAESQFFGHPAFIGEKRFSGNNISSGSSDFLQTRPLRLGRYLHFLSAWLCVLTGLLYVLSGIFIGHFRKDLLPAKSDLAWSTILRTVSRSFQRRGFNKQEFFAYNWIQRLAYLSSSSCCFRL